MVNNTTPPTACLHLLPSRCLYHSWVRTCFLVVPTPSRHGTSLKVLESGRRFLVVMRIDPGRLNGGLLSDQLEAYLIHTKRKKAGRQASNHE
jgi:hypothetical protein